MRHKQLPRPEGNACTGRQQHTNNSRQGKCRVAICGAPSPAVVVLWRWATTRLVSKSNCVMAEANDQPGEGRFTEAFSDHPYRSGVGAMMFRRGRACSANQVGTPRLAASRCNAGIGKSLKGSTHAVLVTIQAKSWGRERSFCSNICWQ